MSYKRFTYITFFFFFLGIFLFVLYFSKIQIHDVKRYMRLAKRDAIAKSLSQVEQTRKNVVKDLYVTTEDGIRLHHRVTSDSSALVIKPRNHKFDIVENLHAMQCLLQDKLYKEKGNSMQQLRFLHAASGLYHFHTHEFSVHEATLSFVRTNGTDLPAPKDLPPPFLQGKAAEVFFVLSGKIPQFTAQQFVATLDVP
jgi:hypothetical protein